MRTTKPFSTISYNSADFLREKLDRLVLERRISFYSYIEHHPEEDEKKKHKHLLIIPNGQINTDELTDILNEIDMTNPLEKPLGVLPWRSSKFDDWYLYSVHDSAYLMTKGQSRKYFYSKDDIISSSEEYLTELIHTIDRSKYSKTLDFVNQIKNGATFEEMVLKGQIPVPLINQFLTMNNIIRDVKTYRNDRETHSPKVNEETGEVIE